MEKFAQAVYNTMDGQLLPAFRVPGVENLFEPGMPCMENYSEMLAAYARLRQRLGVQGDEDPDCETMIDALLDNEYRMAIAMFLKGYEFGRNGCPVYIYPSIKGELE